MLAHRRATASRPWYSRGIGGMELKASSVSRATSAPTSPDSYAQTNFATIASSEGRVGGGRRPVLGDRLSALQADPGPDEGGGDRPDRRLEHTGNPVRSESDDVAPDQDGELARRQDL